ncbi:phosphopantetheine-binding protein [Roseomonas genomospecies 6]|nr:phosphopantetheine-binding protein [Roseomonas genomospecies 6]
MPIISWGNMRYFVAPYGIYFNDTMEYGTHLFIINFKSQCHDRKYFYFRSDPDGVDLRKSDLENIVLLMHEGYCKNLAPAGLGERLAIFMSIGEIARSTVLLCFRVVREDGTPISCGYQRITVIDRSGTEMLRTGICGAVAAELSAPPMIGTEELMATVREVFAETTRYPIDILEPDAGLESDLDIDSVKPGEILGALRTRFAVTAKVEPDRPRASIRRGAMCSRSLNS